ncbi:cbb3-type cytochrome c oxidase subunit I [Adhaeribacter sp. BT258]|uniref:Cbb3-type cytochrome c oxidase subunit I n=1 Tax=Adhaeribacter terrigena TaxID=2793070 RepID=A0ABS1BZ53_9BACT|nr:cbb3-type cytochrome c oxidase subunit I [Adhaeribacter terrigena]MBK0402399.1 cbb3-type cytochrome c oxidase subunit I [Adhaeribacter terrigena]
MKRNSATIFIATALAVFLLGMFFGLLAAAQYVMPGLWRDTLPFTKLRPLHVSMVVFWLLLGASGCVYYFLGTEKLLKRRTRKWILLHYGLVCFVAVGSAIAYFSGNFGGREYWEFPPYLAIPLVLAWVVFLGVFWRSVYGTMKRWPVYYWMWLTGIVFFIFSLAESYLWLLPYFGDDLVRDMAVQWKSYGAIVGSWNQLIYGAAFFLMAKISGDNSFAFSRKTYFFWFLGLTNLMFNWGHHIYALPVSPYIKHTAYLISMTELLIFGKILWEWKRSVSEMRQFFYQMPYRFLAAADVWIFLNLGVAILMSIPALNLHTHGTHVTVAHAMGTTIGINSMILLALAFYIFGQVFGALSPKNMMKAKVGYWLSNGSLLVFWLALMGAGLTNAWYQWYEPEMPHALLMQKLVPFFAVFIFAGIFLFIGFALIVFPLLQQFFSGKKADTETKNIPPFEILEPSKKQAYANEYA